VVVLLTRREMLVDGIAGLAGLAGLSGFVAGCSSQRSRRTEAVLSPELANGRSLAHVGDSISVASQTLLLEMLTASGFVDPIINAQVGRRIEVSGGLLKTIAGSEIVDFLAASPVPPDVWVIALGTNDLGLYTDATAYQVVIDAMLARIPSTAQLVWVDTYASGRLPEADIFNLALRSRIAARGNAVVADWHQRCVDTNGQILTDGIHPTDYGVVAFVDAVKSGLATVLA
jgi:lysophospholipase L1-like esterase